MDKELDERLRAIEQRLANLERDTLPIRRFGEPLQPTLQTFGGNTCPKCKIKLDTVMSYWCSHKDCPTGLGPAMC